ncbi:hypothetical protein BJ322DRAFT_1112270 [Thelephora terrestris]|uniref:F-box domain-containing protein n=1 Tax=Thelephora terrestris TaxID=56493 RepID=A0A9P6L3D5_9AGAM|nr:hypothetical protein BJ322DRAFT_1112270 [Thelephora terrestris]
MLPRVLPPEVLDLIVDHLHDQPTALEECCLVSKSWVPRARSHLFAEVEFNLSRCPIRLWTNAFPDPSNSPAHHTRRLWIYGLETTTASSTVLRQFDCIQELWVAAPVQDFSAPVSFDQLHGLSPTLKTLHLSDISAPASQVFNLICSFPLLEDLWLYFVTIFGGADGWDIPSTSPRLTGSLHLIDWDCSVSRGLLDLPNGLHFTEITASCRVEDTVSLVDLVSRCSDNLESLDIAYSSSSSVYFPDPKPFALSGATKLSHARFQCFGLNVRWITATLLTAQSPNLRKITIVVTSRDTPANLVGEKIRREWQDLDHLLDYLWTSRSVFPEITYSGRLVSQGFGELALRLLPKLASKGAVGRVGGCGQRSEE